MWDFAVGLEGNLGLHSQSSNAEGKVKLCCSKSSADEIQDAPSMMTASLTNRTGERSPYKDMR